MSDERPKGVNVGGAQTKRDRKLKKRQHLSRNVTISANGIHILVIFVAFVDEQGWCTNTMVLHEFAKSLRLCIKFKTAVPVNKK